MKRGCVLAHRIPFLKPVTAIGVYTRVQFGRPPDCLESGPDAVIANIWSIIRLRKGNVWR